MKVVHVLKKIEQIDEDIKELRKMEKSLQRNKSFSAPIFMTIEKQINNMLGDRVKLLELTVANPPAHIAKEFDSIKNDESVIKPLRKGGKPITPKKGEKAKVEKVTGKEPVKKGKVRPDPVAAIDDDDDIPMLTQDILDSRFSTIKNKGEQRPLLIPKKDDDDKDIKLLDIALEKGTLNQTEINNARQEQTEREEKKGDDKRRVRFFRDNFPGGY